MKRGNELVIEYLLKSSNFDPSSENNHAIIYASTSGTPNMVKMLLEDPRVDPSAKENQAVKEAKKENRKVLMRDERVKESLESERKRSTKGVFSKLISPFKS